MHPLQTCPNLELKGLCYGNTNGYASLLVSDKFSTIKRSWETEERCTAILFGATMVMSENAPDSKKTWQCTKNASPVWLKISAKVVKGGARDFYIAVDINVELGLMCTDENGVEMRETKRS